MIGHKIYSWFNNGIIKNLFLFWFLANQPLPNGNNKQAPPVAPKPSREKRSSVDGLLDMLEGSVPDTPNNNYRRYVYHHSLTPPIITIGGMYITIPSQPAQK